MVFSTKCEAENELIAVQIGPGCLLLECQVLLTVIFLVCKQLGEKTVTFFATDLWDVTFLTAFCDHLLAVYDLVRVCVNSHSYCILFFLSLGYF